MGHNFFGDKPRVREVAAWRDPVRAVADLAGAPVMHYLKSMQASGTTEGVAVAA
jgi:hypothetical protein